jgi:hypothetical protein
MRAPIERRPAGTGRLEIGETIEGKHSAACRALGAVTR